LFILLWYSLCSIILVADLDVSIHRICLDTSKFATRIMERREYITLLKKVAITKKCWCFAQLLISFHLREYWTTTCIHFWYWVSLHQLCSCRFGVYFLMTKFLLGCIGLYNLICKLMVLPSAYHMYTYFRQALVGHYAFSWSIFRC
jgi:hypothetical protein